MEVQARQSDVAENYLTKELTRMKAENAYLRIKLEQVRMPPHLVGVVVDIIDEGRIVVKSSAGPTLLVNILDFPGSENIRPGMRVALNQGSSVIVGIVPPTIDPMVHGMEIIEKPTVSFGDIGGLGDQIREIREAVELPLKRPNLFKTIGIDPPGGVLLHGPPGTGKTLLAKAIAYETDATFIKIVGSELVQKYIGEGARLVRELFELAKKKSFSILFIDELDSIASFRYDDSSGDREVQRTMMQLLAEMDGFDDRGGMKIIAATNRIDMLDPAILRPGRFDRIIEIPLPNIDGRREIFKVHLKRMAGDKIDIGKLAATSEGASGADIKAICVEAGMFAIRAERKRVTMDDFLAGAEKVLKKGSKKDLKMFL